MNQQLSMRKSQCDERVIPVEIQSLHQATSALVRYRLIAPLVLSHF